MVIGFRGIQDSQPLAVGSDIFARRFQRRLESYEMRSSSHSKSRCLSSRYLLFRSFGIGLATAQSQEPPPSSDQQAQDVQQLRAKLQQLEQMMGEVKGKLDELEGQPAAHSSKRGWAEQYARECSYLFRRLSHNPLRPGRRLVRHRLGSRLTRRSRGPRARWISMGLP